jgi:hypothetical protein
VASAENNTQKCSKQSRFVFIERSLRQKSKGNIVHPPKMKKKIFGKNETTGTYSTSTPHARFFYSRRRIELMQLLADVRKTCTVLAVIAMGWASFMIVYKSALGVRQRKNVGIVVTLRPRLRLSRL